MKTLGPRVFVFLRLRLSVCHCAWILYVYVINGTSLLRQLLIFSSCSTITIFFFHFIPSNSLFLRTDPATLLLSQQKQNLSVIFHRQRRLTRV